jgi:hypothetical protein
MTIAACERSEPAACLLHADSSASVGFIDEAFRQSLNTWPQAFQTLQIA